MGNKKKKNWVDYKKIKESVSLEQILRRYNVFDKLKPSGTNLVGACPIHKGTSQRSFSVSLERNLFNCFTKCKTGGNVIDFVSLMEFGNKEEKNIRKAGKLLTDWFSLKKSEEKVPKKTANKKSSSGSEKPESNNLLEREEQKTEKEIKENKPLKFELQNLDPEHSFFNDLGLTPETVEYFGLGFCSKGIMKDRIAIPIHNEKGELVAYCGRGLTEKQIKEEKYKQPPNFLNSNVVYNLNRIAPGEKILIVVESFKSVWWLHQNGYQNVVAIMGSFLSEQQAKLITGYFKKAGGLWLAFDADEDGEKCSLQCFLELGKKLYCKNIDIGRIAQKPHQLTPEGLQEIFN